LRRLLFDDDHLAFRDLVRKFYESECAPHADRWEREGQVDRDVWRKAGATGLLGFEEAEEYGGLGIRDFRYNAIVTEEMYATGTVGVGFSTHNNVIGPYLTRLTNDEI
jgi:alkylation response protein AidB-like acyl-CoA dehydrogenase